MVSGPNSRPVVGIDVGGTKILGVAIDLASGSVIARHQHPTRGDNAEKLADAIAGLLEAVLDDPANGLSEGSPVVGVGVPGLVDHDGVLRYGPNVPGVVDLDIVRSLGSRFGLDVAAGNDAANAAAAERRWGAAQGHDHALVITQGTGIGGALIVDGHVVDGTNGFAGEPGHMLVDRSGHRCACGRLGCWETVSSGAGLRNLATDIVAAGGGARMLELAGGAIDALRGEHVAAAWFEGDADAAEVFDQFATWVAVGLGSLITLLDPGVVVLGGGLSEISELYIGAVRDRLPATVMGGSHRPEVPIVAAELGPEAGAIGAGLRAAERFGLVPASAATFSPGNSQA